MFVRFEPRHGRGEPARGMTVLWEVGRDRTCGVGVAGVGGPRRRTTPPFSCVNNSRASTAVTQHPWKYRATECPAAPRSVLR